MRRSQPFILTQIALALILIAQGLLLYWDRRLNPGLILLMMLVLIQLMFLYRRSPSRSAPLETPSTNDPGANATSGENSARLAD